MSVLGDPLHPYTQALKASIPDADPDRKWQDRMVLAGAETEEYLRLGCKFAGRCPQTLEVCQHRQPEEVLVGDRMVRCFRYVDSAPLP